MFLLACGASAISPLSPIPLALAGDAGVLLVHRGSVSAAEGRRASTASAGRTAVTILPMTDQKPEPIPYATPDPRGGWRGWLSRRAATSGQRMLALVAMTWVGFQLLTPSRWADLMNLGWWMIYVSAILFAVEFLLSFFH